MRVVSHLTLGAFILAVTPSTSEAGTIYWTVPAQSKPLPSANAQPFDLRPENAPAPGAGQNQGANQGQNGNGQAGGNQTVPTPIGDLRGLGFGAAIGVSNYSQNNVISTAVQNNVLRLTDGGRSDIGFWLEMHHFWGLGAESAPSGTQLQSQGTVTNKVYTQGVGPFVAVQLGTDDKIIQAVGIGLMWGVRVREGSDTSINFGIGYSAHQISVLTNGLALDQPLPSGVTSATTRSKIVGAPMIITSFSF